jgi:hypothetical protein
MKKQTKTLIIIILVVIILAIALIFLINRTLTGNVINQQNDTYMYTKAICNETNFCQDNEITCNGSQVVSVSPITGAVIQHSKDWQDPRSNEDINKLC